MGASLDVAHCTGSTTCNECGCEADEREGERGGPAPVPDHYQDELCHRNISYERSSFGVAPPPMAVPLAVRSAAAMPEEWDADGGRLPGGPGSTRFLAEEAALLMYVSKRVPLEDQNDRLPPALPPLPQSPQRMASSASPAAAAPPASGWERLRLARSRLSAEDGNACAPPSPPVVHRLQSPGPQRLQSPGPQRMATAPPQGVSTAPLQGLATAGGSPFLPCRASSSLTPPPIHRSASVEPIQGVSTARRTVSMPQRYMSAPPVHWAASVAPPPMHRAPAAPALAPPQIASKERAASAPSPAEALAARAEGPPDVVIRTIDELQAPPSAISRMTTNGPCRMVSAAVPQKSSLDRRPPAMERASVRVQSPQRAQSPQPLEGLSSAPGSDIRRMSSGAAAARNMLRSSTWDVAGLEERCEGKYEEAFGGKSSAPVSDIRRMTTSAAPSHNMPRSVTWDVARSEG